MRPDQLADYRIPSDPRLHPDGTIVAFVVTHMDLDGDRYVRRIWLWDGNGARPFTSGPSDARPRWSPDGGMLAFLRKGSEDDAHAQLAVMPATGGEAEIVTAFPLGVSEAEWSPDGSMIAVVADEWIAPLADLEDDERKRRPRRIVRLPYRFDDDGWLSDRSSHVHVIRMGGDRQARCLTPGDDDESDVAWHPDGTEIAFLSARHPSRELDPGSQVYTVSVDGGEAVARSPVGVWTIPQYDREGTLYALGHTDVRRFVAVTPLRRLADLADLSSFLDRDLVTLAPPLAPGGPQWLDDGSAFTTVEDEGGVRVIRLRLDGTSEDVVGGDRAVTGVSPRPDASAFAFVASTPTDPGELWWWEPGEERRLTDLNAGFRASTPLVEPRRFTIDHDGVVIEGWTYLTPGEGKVPVLLNIHGGPATQYGYAFFDEFQVYAGAGYAVVATNPRGSSGYGDAHLKAVVDRWHEPVPPDLADLLAAVDAAALVEPRLDTTRLGVMGGSYGGLMTVRVITADRRYGSAVAERGLYSWASFAGTSDIGMWFDLGYLGAGPLDDPERLRLAAPLTHVASADTPTLVIHSESDYRTPIEQGEQLFAMLKRLGVATEMLRFPAGEGHELSRSGTPRHRVERFAAILEWHERWLGDPAPAPATPG